MKAKLFFENARKTCAWIAAKDDEYTRSQQRFDPESFQIIIQIANGDEALVSRTNVEPLRFFCLGRHLWLFQNRLYEIKYPVTEEEGRLLVREEFDKDRRKFERLKRKFSSDQPKTTKREKIPENVRIEVWRRDEGKCSKCESRERLEYDHIIPVSKGGSNTARNIELLCETCNRTKSDKIQ